MTKEELIKAVAEKSGLSTTDVQSVINAFTEQIKKQLSKGEKVDISGFGTFILSKHDKTQ